MYTIIGLIIFGVAYVIMNVATLTGFGSDEYIITFLTVNCVTGLAFLGGGIIQNSWIIFIGLMLLVLAFKQYKALIKYHPY